MSERREAVRVARIYLTEAEQLQQKILAVLHDEHRVQGVTVFRGITGFGSSGETHSSSLLDMSFDQPVVIEFFDAAERVDAALDALGDLVPPGHTLTFDAIKR